MIATTGIRKIEKHDFAAIARGLKSGEPEVLHALIEIHQHKVMRYLLHLTGRRDEAEDLFQELWLRVLRSGSSYNGVTPFENWLFAVARNLFFDLKRKRPTASLDDMRATDDGELPFEVTDDNPSPLDQLQKYEGFATVNSELLNLDVMQREVLRLRFQEELTLEEIARLIRVPLSTVKSRLYRGLNVMKLRLEALQ